LKGPIQSVEVSYLVHATEDAGKISKAVESVLGPIGEPVSEGMEGHFGNPIVRVTYHLTGEDAERAFSVLASNLSPSLRQQLKGEMGDHLDEHSAFYVRLDKQRLVDGTIRLTGGDPVRIRVKPRLHLVKGGAASMFAGLLA
jgi:RNA binding exosome subunit